MGIISLRDAIDEGFLHRERVVQRAGWVVVAVLIGAAVAGVFGGGVLSNTTVRTSTGGNELELTHARLGRAESTLDLELVIDAPNASAPEVTAVLSGEIVSKVSITSISPQPDSETPRGDSVAYTWSVDDWSEPVTLRFEYESRDWRTLRGEFDVYAGEQPLGELTFKQFLFP